MYTLWEKLPAPSSVKGKEMLSYLTGISTVFWKTLYRQSRQGEKYLGGMLAGLKKVITGRSRKSECGNVPEWVR